MTLAISIPVVRGGVQQGKSLRPMLEKDFNSRGAWGSSTEPCVRWVTVQGISIPVVRGGVQQDKIKKIMFT